MNCKECPFAGPDPIYGEGTITEGSKLIAVKEDRQWDVVVVGMAPAVEEEKQGRPMVGVSGQDLRRTLYQMGIKDYYITNIFLCPILDDSLVSQAKDCCRDVIEEVLSKRPKLTIALGDLPLHILADTDYKIKEIEGRIIPSKVGPLLPVSHPAYYRRHPDQFYDFLECMRPSIRFLNGQYFQAVEPTHTLVTHENLGEVLNELDKHEEVAVDLETTGFFSHGWEPNRILEMGLAVDHQHAYIVSGGMIDKGMLEEFKPILEKKKGIYWNAQFDAGFLKQKGVTPNVWFDGMLAHYSIDERPYSHGLKKVAGRYLGAGNWEEDLDKYIPKRMKKSVSYEVVPSEVRNVYLAKDVTRTYQLKDALWADINSKVFWNLLMPACRMFIEIEHRGMRVDPVKLMALDETLEKDLEKREEELYELTKESVNYLSSKQVSQLLYEKMEFPMDPHFGPTTSKAYLGQFRESSELIEKILDYREIAKLKGTYIEGFARFVDQKFRIHPSIKIFGSVTGRLSSENPSIMNVKNMGKLREIFLPDSGHILLYSDLKQNELRWYCVTAGDQDLIEVLKNGGDPHELVRQEVYGSTEDGLLKDRQRAYAKAVVFGRIYKRSRGDIERQVGSEVIDKVMEAVDSIAPNIDSYYRSILKQLKNQGYIESFFGRRRRFSLVTPETRHEVERQAVNFPIQSAGSDLMLLTMLHLWKVKDEYGIWPFWPLHDSITMDAVDRKVLPLVKKEMEAYALEVVNGVIPFIWEFDWGINWAMQKE